MLGVSAPPGSRFFFHPISSISPATIGCCGYSNVSSSLCRLYKGRNGLSLRHNDSPRHGVPCKSSFGPGDSDSKNVLDAFFLGKALAEALNERVETALGEFLSSVGKLQAEQQKQMQEFQEDVMERAKKAKERATREALDAQGPVAAYSPVIESVGGTGDPLVDADGNQSMIE